MNDFFRMEQSSEASQACTIQQYVSGAVTEYPNLGIYNEKNGVKELAKELEGQS